MSESRVKRRQSASKQALQELAGVRVALESIHLLLQCWITGQGQPSSVADDRVPHAIELHARKKVG
jgi:hypothetical protein